MGPETPKGGFYKCRCQVDIGECILCRHLIGVWTLGKNRRGVHFAVDIFHLNLRQVKVRSATTECTVDTSQAELEVSILKVRGKVPFPDEFCICVLRTSCQRSITEIISTFVIIFTLYILPLSSSSQPSVGSNLSSSV